MKNREREKSPSNVLRDTSRDLVPAPDSFLQNKLKGLFKNKSLKSSATRQQKETIIGKLLSRNKSSITSSSTSKLTPTTKQQQNESTYNTYFAFY